jgi:hypothetical protein
MIEVTARGRPPLASRAVTPPVSPGQVGDTQQIRRPTSARAAHLLRRDSVERAYPDATGGEATGHHAHRAGTDPAWYASPDGAPLRRYWDGRHWTEHTIPTAEDFPTYIDPDIAVNAAPAAGRAHNFIIASGVAVALLLLVVLASWTVI